MQSCPSGGSIPPFGRLVGSWISDGRLVAKTKAFYLLSICLFKYSFKLVADYWSITGFYTMAYLKKVKAFPYSIPSVGP